MLIVCPSCATSYNVGQADLPQSGRQVRCARCRTVWHADPIEADTLGGAEDNVPGGPGRIASATAAPLRPEPVPAVADDVAWQDSALESAVGEGGGSNFPAAQPDLVPASRDGGAAAAPPPLPMVEVEAPPLVPAAPDAASPPVQIEGSAGAAADAAQPEDIETYAARRTREERLKLLRWPLSLMQSVALLLLIVDAVLIGWRDDMVRLLPQTASFYAELGLTVNTRGLSFTDVSTTAEKHEGVPILVVEGSIINDTRKFVDVPRLKFAVRNGADEEIYSWTAVPPHATLAPGESVVFRSRLASPPPDGRTVLVRFVTRHDLVAGGR
jgi:predicted Zn finger-like uncharacterized protein